MANLKIKKIHPDATIPKYAHKGDSGMDVFAIQNIVLNSRERALLQTGLQFEIPKGYEIQVRPKSGLAIKDGITCLNSPATIDSNYRGELGIILINHSSKPFAIEKGKKIAQIVLSKVEIAKIKVVDKINETSRGGGGFGSTGK